LTMKTTIGVIGAGNTAATLAILAARSGCKVLFFAPDSDKGKRSGNRRTLLERLCKGKVPKQLACLGDLKSICRKSSVIMPLTPSGEFPELIRSLGDFLSGDQIIVHAARGIDFDGESITRMSQIIARQSCVRKIGVLAGPFFHEEILAGQPAALVIASAFHEVVDATREIFDGAGIQLFSGDDVAGAELGSAMSDIYAVAGGIASALGFGAGTQAFIATRGLAEMSRFGVVCGAKATTFSGLSGLGALMASISNENSAAFQLGVKLGRQRKRQVSLLKDLDTHEMLSTLRAAEGFARKKQIQMPILFSVHKVLSGKRSAAQTTKVLVAGQAGTEADLTLDHMALNLPIPTTAPKGGRGKG
jgi:glycerol-3-phosphate dehydrogenase (NAD(P)+)